MTSLIDSLNKGFNKQADAGYDKWKSQYLDEYEREKKEKRG